MKTIALYAGSFDPLTLGHLDILNKAVMTFDVVYVAIGQNPVKRGFFPVEQRMDLISSSIVESGKSALIDAVNSNRLVIDSYQGISIIRYANQIGATHIVRGLRQAGDFNDEFALTGTATHLDSDIIFTHFIGNEKFLHVSSSTARELASLSEDISWLVTPSVADALEERFQSQRGE